MNELHDLLHDASPAVARPTDVAEIRRMATRRRRIRQVGLGGTSVLAVILVALVTPSLNNNRFTFAPGGSQPTQSTSERIHKSPPGDARRGVIAFVSYRGAKPFLTTIRADGSQQTRMPGKPTPTSRLSWSPDGRHLVYGVGLSEGMGQLVVRSVETGEERILVRPDAVETPQGPDVAPDGRTVALYSGDGRLFTVRWDGSDLTMLTDPGSCFHSDPAWSPDGTMIAFTRECEGVTQLYTITSDGQSERPLVAGEQDSNVDWSPDGSAVVFQRRFPGDRTHIMLARADGTGLRQITTESENFYPRFSPDGSMIAFVSNRDGSQEIYLIAEDGSGERRLTDPPGNDIAPAWRPGES